MANKNGGRKMKAWFSEKQAKIEEEPLKLKEAPPLPKDNQMRIMISDCGLCRTNLHIIEGDLVNLPSIN
jgi:propanol-preferring alcohol dehydrogenase